MRAGKKCFAIMGLCVALVMGGCKADTEKETTASSEKIKGNTEVTSQEHVTESAKESVTESTKESEIESAAETSTEIQPPAYVTASFSGDAGKVIEMESDALYEGENYVLFIQKGACLPDNTPELIEEIMALEEEVYPGLSYSGPSKWDSESMRALYIGHAFDGVDFEDKLNIIIAKTPDNDTIQVADGREAVVFDEDFSVEATNCQTLYHELAHVLRLRQSGMLGQVFEEGIACYAEYQLALKRHTAAWNMVQYIRGDGYISNYDEDTIVADPEKAFIEANNAPRSAGQVEYQYGIRLIAFLMEEYGPDVIADISSCAAKKNKDSVFDDATVVAIIKEATSDDVFERFGAWLPEGYGRFCAGVEAHLKEYGM